MNSSWFEHPTAKELLDRKDPLLESPDKLAVSTDENVGADYLRNLKQGQSKETPAQTSPMGALANPEAGTASGSSSSWSGRERRRSIRYKCHGSAEFRFKNTGVRTWGSLTDISLHGCYVEMMQTSPSGTPVDLVLEANGIRIEVQGEVRVNYPFLGVGIVFTEVASEQQHHLQELLKSFSDAAHHPASPQKEEREDASSEVLPVIVDAAAALSAIVKFFQTRSVLTRHDFGDLMRKGQS